jgi:hypothetical protein
MAEGNDAILFPFVLADGGGCTFGIEIPHFQRA